MGLAGGLLEGAPIRFATEIARVADEGDALHVLPIVTRGPTENVEALLYLRGVDAAIINSDALEQFRTLVPNIDQRISYILNLFPSDLHVFVRPEIQSLADLRGKRVNFNTPGTTAAYSGPLIFNRLRLDVEKTFIPHPAALEQMRKGEGGMAGVVFVTSKPVDAFSRGRWDPGFKFLPVESEDLGFYTPSALTSQDYPQLIREGEDVPTISVPTILAAYNWPKGSDRYARLARLVDHLFSRLDQVASAGLPSRLAGRQRRGASARPEAVHRGARVDRPQPRQSPARGCLGGLRRAHRGSAAALSVPFNSGAAMTRHLGLTTLLVASLAAMPVLSSPACAQSSSSSRPQTSAPSSSAARTQASARQHRVVIQVSENDPRIMNSGAQQRREPEELLRASGRGGADRDRRLWTGPQYGPQRHLAGEGPTRRNAWQAAGHHRFGLRQYAEHAVEE